MKDIIKRKLKELIEKKFGEVDLDNLTLKGLITCLLNKMLIRSVKHSNKFLCNLFLKLGANINCKDSEGRTLLKLVIDKTEMKVIDTEKSLLKKKIDMINFLYSKGIDINNTSNGYTALQCACMCNNIKIVRELIKLNANVNFKNTAGETALLIACKNNYNNIVNELLKGNADIRIPDLDGMTPLHIAIKMRNLMLVEGFINIDRNIINERDINGNTPLIYACTKAYSEIIDYLLKNGANPNFYNIKGETPVHIAFYNYNQNPEMLSLLIYNNADINAKVFGFENQETILHMACRYNYTRLAWFLVKNGAKVNISDNYGFTALHYACYNNNSSLVELLINNGADVYARTAQENISPLGICLEKQYYEISIGLIRYNNNLIHEKYNNNWKLIHYAAKNNWLILAEFLYRCKINLEEKTAQGFTALDIAKENNNYDIVNFLNEKIKLSKNINFYKLKEKGEIIFSNCIEKGLFNLVAYKSNNNYGDCRYIQKRENNNVVNNNYEGYTYIQKRENNNVVNNNYEGYTYIQKQENFINDQLVQYKILPYKILPCENNISSNRSNSKSMQF